MPEENHERLGLRVGLAYPWPYLPMCRSKQPTSFSGRSLSLQRRHADVLAAGV
ncbi:MAG TPA: hypothetical protein VK762_34195 [Polyangiaceae bacterium]|jgi:hypothetical protein|nr:hypothetical protein [Polyangiaceae bacterium]